MILDRRENIREELGYIAQGGTNGRNNGLKRDVRFAIIN